MTNIELVEHVMSESVLSLTMFIWASLGSSSHPVCCNKDVAGAIFSSVYCLSLVLEASALRAEDPGFASHSQRDFSGVESYQ